MANVLSACYRDTDRLAPAIAIAEESLRLDPDDLDGPVLLSTSYALSDLVEEVREVGRRIKEVEPTFTISRYIERQPYKDEAPLARMVGALRDAGLTA